MTPPGATYEKVGTASDELDVEETVLITKRHREPSDGMWRLVVGAHLLTGTGRVFLDA